MKTHNKSIAVWLYFGVFMILIQILLGGITRLTGSGLSITEWAPILGTIPPLNDAQWHEAFLRYQQIPQYELVNNGMTLSEFKGIYFWEYLHRLWARSMGSIFLLPLLYFLFTKKIKWVESPQYFAILILGGIQGAMGWIMVQSGLTDRTLVEPTKLTLHLLLAAALIALVFKLALENSMPKYKSLKMGKHKILIPFLFVLVLIQMTFGGMVAGSKAALSFPTWPDMNGLLIPNGLFELSPWWKNMIENNATTQFFHRCMAYIITVAILLFYILSTKWNINQIFRKLRRSLLFVLLTQIILGVCTLIFSKSGHIPVTLAVMHQQIAFILLLNIMALHYFNRKVEAS